MAFPHKFSTIMEVDYDTPYDRHIIIEESKDTKHKRPRLEEPGNHNTFGSKIFRRLSKRMSGHPDHPTFGSAAQGSTDSGGKFGLDNPSMELDPPKSPWRYPHRTFATQQQRPSSRSESRKSTKSVNFRNVSVYGNTLHPSSAAIPPASSMDEDEVVEVIPDVHTPSSSESGKVEQAWDLDSSSSHSSSEGEGEEELERVQNIPISSVLNFQNQFRSSASRQNSGDWNEPDVLVVKQPLHKTHSAQSGHGTPKRSTSNEDSDSINAIQLDRTGSKRSALATVSARISAAMEADRSSRY